MVSKSCGRFATFEPNEHLNRSNRPFIILSAISAGDAGSRFAMSLKRSSKSCCTRMSINADPTGLPSSLKASERLFLTENIHRPSTLRRGNNLVGSPFGESNLSTFTSSSGQYTSRCQTRNLQPTVVPPPASQTIMTSSRCRVISQISAVRGVTNLQILSRDTDCRGLGLGQGDPARVIGTVSTESG